MAYWLVVLKWICIELEIFMHMTSSLQYAGKVISLSHIRDDESNILHNITCWNSTYRFFFFNFKTAFIDGGGNFHHFE